MIKDEEVCLEGKEEKVVEKENVVAPPATPKVPKKAPTTRKGREAVAKKAKKGEELVAQQREHMAALDTRSGPVSEGSIKSLSKRIRETTEDGRFVYEVLRDILMDGGQHASDRIAAGKVLLERGWGKVPDVVILEEIIRPENVLKNFSIEMLKEMVIQAKTVEGEVREL